MIRTSLASLFLIVALSGSATAQSPSGDGKPQEWQLVWADEFNGDQIDPTRWDFDVDCWGGGNNERQCYTASPRNVQVKDGALHIIARREDATGYALPASQRATAKDPNAKATKPFTSARLVTRGKASWLYGRIEVRAKLPQGQGTWPAIWMLPEDWAYGPWPLSGEIDILEAVNLGVPCAKCPGGRENTILGTLHFGASPPNNRHKSTEIHFPEVLDGFHVYGIEWSPGRIVWTLNGKPYAEQKAGDWHTAASTDPNAPFNKPFHLILNLAIGGGLPESRGLGGVSDEGFPKEMVVDWVRVWKHCAEDANKDRCAN